MHIRYFDYIPFLLLLRTIIPTPPNAIPIVSLFLHLFSYVFLNFICENIWYSAYLSFWDCLFCIISSSGTSIFLQNTCLGNNKKWQIILYQAKKLILQNKEIINRRNSLQNGKRLCLSGEIAMQNIQRP